MSRVHAIGTQVQEKNGRVRVKLPNGKWESRARLAYQKAVRRVKPHERVFHMNGERDDDNPKNLVAIAFGVKHYDLQHSQVIWKPK